MTKTQLLHRNFSFIVILLLGLSCHAQRKYTNLGFDLGGTIGFAKYFGEIGESSALYSPRDLRQTRWNIGGFVRNQFTDHFALRFNLQYYRLQGADSTVSDVNRFTRNLHFINDVIEGSLDLQYVWNLNQASYRNYSLDRKVYAFTGLAVFTNNPKARREPGDKFTSLRPLKTENQEYSGVQVGIPVGVGMDYIINRHHRIGVYFRFMFTFTDYLDDASTFYPDPQALESDEARYFSNRTAEVQNTPQAQTIDNNGSPLYLAYKEGGVRGNPNSNDYIMHLGVTYSFVRPKTRRRF